MRGCLQTFILPHGRHQSTYSTICRIQLILARIRGRAKAVLELDCLVRMAMKKKKSLPKPWNAVELP
jgi:hypothetical protein